MCCFTQICCFTQMCCFTLAASHRVKMRRKDDYVRCFLLTLGVLVHTHTQAKDLIPTPMSQLEPTLVHNATMAAASSALASVARGPQKEVDDGSCFLNEEDEEASHRRKLATTLSGCCPASLEGTEDCVIKAEVKGNSLEILHWSTLWSQVYTHTNKRRRMCLCACSCEIKADGEGKSLGMLNCFKT